ncbi:hypothetical protein P7C73_g6284, partial [Tremellales sp. Uapishka_1]
PPSRKQPLVTSRNSSLPRPSQRPFSTAIAETLVIGPNGIQALSPTPTILKLEQMCLERRMDEAIALVDGERRKGRRGEIEGEKALHTATLRFLHLYLAIHLFNETMFERAGDYFSRGKLDPRLLVRLYEDFRGKIIGSEEQVEVFLGLQDALNDMKGVDQIIQTSIERNYSPHIHPDVETAPETSELREALADTSESMLTEFLRRTRTSRRKGGGSRGVDSRKIDIVIDTTLAKLLADAGTTNELLAILAAPNDVVLSELEPFLRDRKYVLSTVMRKQGRLDRVLALLKEIAEDSTSDPLCPDPIDEMAQQLESVDQEDLFKRYTLWLISRDLDKGLKLLLRPGMKFDEVLLVDELRGINDEAANRYLEFVVVMKRSPVSGAALRGEVTDRSAESTTARDAALATTGFNVRGDTGRRNTIPSRGARLLVDPPPFCIFFSEIAPATPIKKYRLKLMLFLQGSPFYDLENVVKRLEATEMAPLKMELAIVLGRLGRHRQALQLLARDLADSTSAQTYCTTNGEVIPSKIARWIARIVPDLQLQGWATLGDVGRKRKGPVDEVGQKRLIMELLGAYMIDGKETTKQTAELLNAQSVHLDVLETSETYLAKVAHIPPITVSGPSPDQHSFVSPDEGSIAEKEFTALDEKQDGFFGKEQMDKELRDLEGEGRGEDGEGRRVRV